MNNIDKQYLDLIRDILENGVEKKDRTGTGTLSVFGRQIRHKMSEGFPLLTTKKMFTKGIIGELLWFLRGETNIKWLVENDIHIWDGDCYKNYCKSFEKQSLIEQYSFDTDPISQEMFINKIKKNNEFAKTWGELGPIYGKQWRGWNGIDRDSFINTDNMEDPLIGGHGLFYQPEQIDQIQNLINDLKTNPDSRRLMVNAWNPADLPVTDYRTDDELYQDFLKAKYKNTLSKEEFLEKLKTDKDFNNRYGRKHITEGKMVLPPCHYGFQVYTRELSLEEKCNWLNKNYPSYGLEEWTKERLSDDDYLKEVELEYNIPTRAISLMWNQRSVDTGLGLPFNIASYALLLEILGKLTNMVPDELIGNLGDTHLYLNHVEPIKEQLTREPYELPRLSINTEFWLTKSGECGVGDLSDNVDSLIKGMQIDDFYFENYKSHSIIKLPLSN